MDILGYFGALLILVLIFVLIVILSQFLLGPLSRWLASSRRKGAGKE